MAIKAKKKYPAFIPHAEAGLSAATVRAAHRRAEDEILGVRLARLRHEFGVRQSEIQNFSQSGVSKIEGRRDMKVSTLVDYVRCLGLELEITVRPRRASGRTRSFTLLRT